MDVSYDGYLGVFVALVASTTIFPIPEELPVIWAGVQCGLSDTEFANDRGNPARLLWWVMLPVVIVGAVIGDIVLYTIGRLWGKKLLDLQWVQRRLISPEQRAKIERNFAKHGIKVLLGVRLLPGVRGWVFLIAGMVRLPLWQFILADAIYAIPIVNLMFWTAYWFTDQIMVLVNELNTYKSLVVSHVLAAVAGALIYRYLIARRVPTGETPPIVEKAAKVGHAIESAFESVADAVTGRHHHEPDPAKKADATPETGNGKPESGAGGQESAKPPAEEPRERGA
jgi:membrane protein DedA with SNARE-associated domain